MLHSSHAESRIVEEFFKKGIAEGEILMRSINWPDGPKKGLSPKSSCKDCGDLLGAVSECMAILLCDENDKPKAYHCD
jgi:hypothetical protein